jgi:serine/threonine-protein kinase
MLQPRTLINGRYRVDRLLGEGGMAVVYLGHDLQLGRAVAIKTLRPQFAADPAFRARFEREARAAASLSHPNIIDVHDVGEADGIPFIVMELVRGQSLREIIAAEAPFHPDDVAALLKQIAAALDYAHSRGYVHRDVKPANILVDEHGRARVVDFGIAKGLADSDLTETGAGFGTAAYISPEQAAGLMATPASDVYSAGIVAFEMLAGRLPFRAETPVGLALRHVNDQPPAPSRLRADTPPAVDAIVLRALAKDPTRRWPSVGAFAHALGTWRDREQHAPTSPAPVQDEPALPSRASPLVTAAVIAIVIGALAALLWAGMRLAPLGGEGGASVDPTPVAPIVTDGRAEPTATATEGVPTITTIDVAALEPTPPEPETAAAAPTIAPTGAGTIAVPNLHGLTIGGATGALLPQGLRIALDQTRYSDTIPLNAIVAQDPPPGARVAPGTVIRVTLSRGPSPFPDNDRP